MRTRIALLLLAACLLLPETATAKDDAAIELLREGTAKIVHTTARGSDRAALARIADGDAKSAAVVTATAEAPLEVVYTFAAGEVTLTSVTIELPPGVDAKAQAASVEILVSRVSAHAGYRSLRVCRLVGPKPNPSCRFVQTGATWVLLRVTPVPGAEKATIGEVRLRGHIGPPASQYAFKESPAKAFDVIAQLEKLGGGKITDVEKALFADAADGKLDDHTFGEAALIASGVTDAAARKAQLARLEAIEKSARAAVGDGGTAFERGERLLTHLHEGPMKKGYISKQTLLSTVLDDGTFNCVSSAVLYNVIGRRLGLDLRAIEVPTHAFSVLYDGTKHADVEVTTPQGFNPSRDPAAAKAFEAQTGFRYIPELHPEQRREIGPLGLIATIYYNRGVGHAEASEFDQALRCGFCALSLDREFGSAVKNTLASLANWGVHLSHNKRFADAVKVLEAALTLAPDDATLQHNRLAIWQSHIRHTIDAGNTDAALAVVQEAHKRVPDGGFDELAAWVFLKPAEAHMDAKRFAEGIATADSGLAKLEGAARVQLVRWQANAYLRWSNTHVRANEFTQAIAVLEQGLPKVEDRGPLEHNLAFSAQELMRAARDAGDATDAEAALEALMGRHPKSAAIASVARNHVLLLVQSLAQKGKHAEALAAIERKPQFVPEADDRARAYRTLYDDWAEQLRRRGDHRGAFALYGKALEHVPGDKHLTHNRSVVFQHWAVNLARKGQFADAHEVLAEGRKALGPDGIVKNTYQMVVDTEADALRKAGKWTEAVALYTKALEAYPKNSHLTQNAKFTWNGWAMVHLKAEEWAQAIEVLEKALKQFPGDRTFKNNLGYAKQRQG